MKILKRGYSLSELYRLRKSIFRAILNYDKAMNYLFLRASLFLKREKVWGLPANILIEPTADCNYDCIKCEKFTAGYADDGPIDGRRNMSFEHYKRIIDEIGSTLITLRLWHYGEPLLHKDLFLMIEYAKKKGIFVVVSSNLSLLDGKTAQRMIDSGLDYLIISFDGASERTYKLYHGKDCFNRIVKNMELLISLKKKSGSEYPFVELQFIVMKENEKEMADVAALAKRIGIDKLTYQKLQADRLEATRLTKRDPDGSVLPVDGRFCFDPGQKKNIDFCSIPWEETVIRYSGLVIPCAFDIGQIQSMGRLFRNGEYQGLRRIWNGPEYQNFRGRVKKGLDLIKTCSLCEKRDNNCNDQIVN